MRLIGFGASASHPRLGVPMVDDAFLQLRSGTPEDVAKHLDTFAHAYGPDTYGSFLRRRSVVPRSVGVGAMHGCIRNPTDSDDTFVVSYGPGTGWTADLYETFKKAVEMHRRLTMPTPGGSLVLHGEYSTDGSYLYRSSLPVEPWRAEMAITTDQFRDDSEIGRWMDLHPDETGIVGLLLPDLMPGSLLSYQGLADRADISLKWARQQTFMYEGTVMMPFRQASSDTGVPMWSRAVIADWVARRNNRGKCYFAVRGSRFADTWEDSFQPCTPANPFGGSARFAGKNLSRDEALQLLAAHAERLEHLGYQTELSEDFLEVTAVEEADPGEWRVLAIDEQPTPYPLPD